MELLNHYSFYRANGHLPPLKLTTTANRHQRVEETSKEARSSTCQSKGTPLTFGQEERKQIREREQARKNEKDEREDAFAWIFSSAAMLVSSAHLHSSHYYLKSLFISLSMGLKKRFWHCATNGIFQVSWGRKLLLKKSGLPELQIILLFMITEDNSSVLSSHSTQKEQGTPKLQFSGK